MPLLQQDEGGREKAEKEDENTDNDDFDSLPVATVWGMSSYYSRLWWPARKLDPADHDGDSTTIQSSSGRESMGSIRIYMCTYIAVSLGQGRGIFLVHLPLRCSCSYYQWFRENSWGPTVCSYCGRIRSSRWSREAERKWRGGGHFVITGNISPPPPR